MDLFTNLSERFKFKDKKVRLFECFSGIGTQAMALKRLGVEVEHIGFSEIDKYAIQSYLAIHGDVKNYGDITKIKGIELPKIDILTWSFPCTDLSKAGKQKGLENTRSGLGYEVIRIIGEMKEKPTVLLMENVPDLIGSKFRKGWGEMYHAIEKLGYKNHVEILNAKNYGVAQNRNRVFMVSILGNYAYEFPKPFKLEKRLKDYLEDEVDEKYYLNDRFIEQMTKDVKNYNRKDKFIGGVSDGDTIARTITTKLDRPESNYITIPFNKTVDKSGLSPTLTTRPEGKKTAILPVTKDLRIRKLTPREALRLMDVSEHDIDIILATVSNTQAYKLAGNAIVVDVLAEIFRGLS